MPIILLVLLVPLLMAAASSDPVLDVVNAVVSGDARVIAAAVLSLLMVGLAGLRAKLPWLRTDRGGTVLVLALSVLGAIAAAITSGAAINFKLFLTAFEVGLLAIGGYTGVKRLVWPKDATAAAIAGVIDNVAASKV